MSLFGAAGFLQAHGKLWTDIRVGWIRPMSFARRIDMLSLCCTRAVRDRLHLAAQLTAPVKPSTRLGNWYVHLARFGRQQIVLATSERSVLTVLIPAQQLRNSIEANLQAAVGELLTALQVPGHIVSRELAAMQPL